MIKSLLAIDPGNDTGLATFELGPCGWVLRMVRCVHPEQLQRFPRAPFDMVVIENPRIYPQMRVDPNDIVTLGRCVGRYQERYLDCPQRLVAPRDWKGTIAKSIFTARIEAHLTPSERALCDNLPSSQRHNAIDAVGLGKWALTQPWVVKG